jgi:hypothetical protein
MAGKFSGNRGPGRLIGDGRDGGGEAGSAAVLCALPRGRGPSAPHPACRQSLAGDLRPRPAGSSALAALLSQPLLAGVILLDTAP